MTAFIVRDCVRCGVKKIQHLISGQARMKESVFDWEVLVQCSDCLMCSIYPARTKNSGQSPQSFDGNIETACNVGDAIHTGDVPVVLDASIPGRIADLFHEASFCRQMGKNEAAGAIFRKTLDVATMHLYSADARLAGRNPATALRSRISALGQMGILEADIVELADITALDGNDAAHDVNPYTSEEASALEDLTLDLLDRLFVRPAKIAAVRAKQIASGQRTVT